MNNGTTRASPWISKLNLSTAMHSYAARFPGTLDSEQFRGLARMACMGGWWAEAATAFEAVTEPLDLDACIRKWRAFKELDWD